MSEGFDLGAFLAEQRAEGEQDSEGSFTVATDRAQTKLGEFMLTGEFDWVLKVVQSVNAWRAPELRLRQTRVATSFYFCPPSGKSFPTDSVIVSALRSGSLNPDDPVDQLCMALRALVNQGKLSFVLAIRNQGQLGEPIFAGDDTTRLDSKTRHEWANLADDGVRLTVSHFQGHEGTSGRYVPTFSGIQRRDLEITRVLQQRALVSPSPIFLDGRLLTNLATHPEWGMSRRARPLGYGQGDRDVGFALSRPLGELQIPVPAHDNQEMWYYLVGLNWMALRSRARKLQSMLDAFEPKGAEYHRVHWVRHGVVVNAQPVTRTSEHLALAIFLPAEAKRTDLTGLRVDKDPDEAAAAATVVTQRLAQLLERLEELADLSEVCAEQTARRTEEAELQAGYSVYTESLGKVLPGWRKPARKFANFLDSWGESDRDRASYADLWRVETANDLESLGPTLVRKLKKMQSVGHFANDWF